MIQYRVNKLQESIGNTYGFLTVLDIIDNFNLKCVCKCGKEKKVLKYKLFSGHTKSCGCYKLKGRDITHWLSKRGKKTNLYTTWCHIKARCYNPNNAKYSLYGARGIKVCEQWLNNPVQFAKDMGEKPSAYHSIDRIDVNGDYSPENCRWATPKTQSRNKTNNVLVLDLETGIFYNTIIEAAEANSLNYNKFREKIRYNKSSKFVKV